MSNPYQNLNSIPFATLNGKESNLSTYNVNDGTTPEVAKTVHAVVLPNRRLNMEEIAKVVSKTERCMLT